VPLTNSPADRADLVAVQALLADVLGVDVPEGGSFIGHGGDSFHAVLVVARIEEEWGVEVDFIDVLDSTPEALAELVGSASNGFR
jgi:acyl carrier protein